MKVVKGFASPIWKMTRTRRLSPINKEANHGAVDKRFGNSKPDSDDRTRLYLVKFTQRTNEMVSFLKIGISTMSIEARFLRDYSNYKVDLIASSPKMRPGDAYKMEQAIHAAFRHDRHWPNLRLNSGNTECYTFTEETALKFVRLFSAL